MAYFLLFLVNTENLNFRDFLQKSFTTLTKDDVEERERERERERGIIEESKSQKHWMMGPKLLAAMSRGIQKNFDCYFFNFSSPLDGVALASSNFNVSTCTYLGPVKLRCFIRKMTLGRYIATVQNNRHRFDSATGTGFLLIFQLSTDTNFSVNCKICS